MSLSVISFTKEPVLAFGLLMLIILFVPLLFQRMKLPGIVGLLVAGSVVGPNSFGILEGGGVIDALGKVGLLYLMFLAGLEISLDQIRKEQSSIAVFGVLTFAIPITAGIAVFWALGYSGAATVLIASMFASHTLVAYPIITRLGLTKDRSVASAVGGTILTDTAALLILAVVARTAEGQAGWSFWLTFTVLFAVYLAFMFFALPKLSYGFFKSIGEKGRYTYVYVIGIMLMCAWLAEEIGIEAIVGAFFAGLAFNRLLSNKGPLKNRIEFFGDAFFIPLFLVYVGMLVDFKVMFSSIEMWVVMAIMVGLVVATKWLAAFASGKLLGFSNDQSWVVFGLTNTQAAATLAAVFVGLQLNIFGDEILNGAIMMILVTCIIGPIVVEKYGLRLADSVTQEVERGPKVNQRILVPLSNPTTSARLIEFASNLKSGSEVDIYPLSVLNTINDFQARQERAQKTLDTAVGQIHAVNCTAVPVLETNLNIAEGISLAVVKHAATDIVIGWNGEISATRRIFGSVLDQMLETTSRPVYVCKLDQPVSTFRTVRIVIPPKTMVGPTFLALFTNVLVLAENLNAATEVCVTEAERGLLDRNLVSAASPVTPKIREFPAFDQLLETVVDETADTELMILVSHRPDEHGWAQGANLVPRMMARQKPTASFVVAYPENLEAGGFTSDVLYPN